MSFTLVRFTRVGAGADGTQIHLAVEPSDALRVHLVAQATQVICHPGHTIKWGIHVLFVDLLHQFLIIRTIFKGRIVEAASGNIQQLTLA